MTSLEVTKLAKYFLQDPRTHTWEGKIEIFSIFGLGVNLQEKLDDEFKNGSITLKDYWKEAIHNWIRLPETNLPAFRLELEKRGFNILAGNLQTKLGPRLWPTTQYCALQELIKDKDLSIQKCLDVGEFGSVYKILDCQDLKTYALKVIPIGKYAKNASDIAKIKKIYRESEVMRKLGSSEQNAKQHVVTLRDVWFEGDFKNEFQRIVSSNDILKELYLPYQPIHSTTMVLKMDYYKTDLDTWMIQNREPTLGVVEIIIGQLFKGLSFIHSEQICHRDLRPTNIFVNYANGVIELKIGDFATAREITDAETFLTRCQVSTDFQSPELKSGMKFENKSEYYKTDVYSLGLIYLVLISEWKQKSEYQILIEQSNGSYAGVFDKIKAVFPNKFCFLQKMLTKDVAKRPSSVDGVDYFANLLL